MTRLSEDEKHRTERSEDDKREDMESSLEDERY
jgi:hypothetical protein